MSTYLNRQMKYSVFFFFNLKYFTNHLRTKQTRGFFRHSNHQTFKFVPYFIINPTYKVEQLHAILKWETVNSKQRWTFFLLAKWKICLEKYCGVSWGSVRASLSSSWKVMHIQSVAKHWANIWITLIIVLITRHAILMVSNF